MRCYNGCPDDEMQEYLDIRRQVIKDALKQGVTLTYFPMEGKWKAFKDLHSRSGFHDEPQQAFEEAMKDEKSPCHSH